ncbi:MAG: thioredoxin [Bacteroidetes bacterium]|nr:MAG: thioredoxin [Bacteroidota bacterium]
MFGFKKKATDTPSGDHEVRDFEADVIEASRTRPVLVDFWAPWCGPCRMLGPTLEQLAAESDGAWTLVKVNTDIHPDLAARYEVRGIPTVKLFIDGEPVDGFLGALPAFAVKRWLKKALPS